MFSIAALAWDGYDWQERNFIDVDDINGDEVDFFDYSDGRFHTGTIVEIDSSGDITIEDNSEGGRIREFDMD